MPAHQVPRGRLEARGAVKKHPERYVVPEIPEESTPKKRKKGRDYARVMKDYVRGVLTGEIPACQLARLAVERHVKDQTRGGDYPYRFDAKRARKALGIMERFPHVKGKWKGKPIRLAPWQVFIFGSIFGWVSRKTKRRRFRQAYVCIPRKNGKSILAAATGNYMLIGDGENGPEVYCGATTEKQALEVFTPAKRMFEGAPDLMEEHSVEVWAKSIVTTEDDGRFWPVIGKPGDGSSPSCAIVDEYHEHATSEQLDTMVTGMGARDNPLLLVITTAGTDLASPCYDKHQAVVKILEGTVEDENVFGIIHSIDPEDDWADPKSLAKANPNWGISVNEEIILAAQRQAVLNPRDQNIFKTKHLNIWCNASVAGINSHQWELAKNPRLKLEDFAGEEAFFGLDLASKLDVTAFVQVVRRREHDETHWYVFGRYYLPEDTIYREVRAADRSNQDAYKKWVIEGFLRTTDGAEMDFDQVRDDVLELKSIVQVKEIVFDAWRATHLSHHLTAAGARCVEFPQGNHHMAPGFDELAAALASGRLHHDGNPVLTWMASNTVAKSVAKGLVIPGKDPNRTNQKIDGIVALCMCLARGLANQDKEYQMLFL